MVTGSLTFLSVQKPFLIANENNAAQIPVQLIEKKNQMPHVLDVDGAVIRNVIFG